MKYMTVIKKYMIGACALVIGGASAMAQYSLPTTTTSASDVAGAGGNATADLVGILVGFTVAISLIVLVAKWFMSRRKGA